MKPTITWVLVADGRSARIFENDGPGTGLSPCPEKTWEAPARAEFSDRQGRSFQSAGARRHKMEPRGAGGHDALAFAKQIVDDLSRDFRRHSFQRLILCAPPAFLGKLRKALNTDLSGIVLAEVANDLIHTPENGLAKHFEKVLAV